MIIKSEDNKLYDKISAGPWTALIPAEVLEVKNPRNRWSGGKILLRDWQRIAAFLEWSLKETDSETVVHLYYNDKTLTWHPLVLPQKGYSGMTVSVLENHPNYLPTKERLGPGWGPLWTIATVHHHCRTSAFQSSGDHEDEKTKEGLHVTVGHIGSEKYDLHARSCFKHTFMPIHLSDWFEIPEKYNDLPLNLRDAITTHLLTEPSDQTKFPDWWKENVIKVPAPVVIPQVPSWNKEDHDWWSKGWTYTRPEVAQTEPSSLKTMALIESLNVFAIERGTLPKELLSQVVDIENDPILAELIEEIVIPYGACITNVVDALSELVEKEEEQ